MLTPSKRAACQRFFESKFGAASPEELADFNRDLRKYRISLSDENALRECSVIDATACFERGSLSLFQAVRDLNNGDTLWAAVKFYYSIFYFIKSELFLDRLFVLRAGDPFIVHCRRGSDCKRYKGRFSGDHALSLMLFERERRDDDIMLSQSIDGRSVYSWMKTVREDVQYKLRRPPEMEDFDPFFPDKHWDIGSQIETFLNDSDPIFCFDPDYAALAIPIKRFQFTARRFIGEGIRLESEFQLLCERFFSAGLPSNRLRALMPF